MRYFVHDLDRTFVVLPLSIGGVAVPPEEAIDAYDAGELKSAGVFTRREDAETRMNKLNRGK